MALRRILTIAGLNAFRSFRSPVNVLWIVVIPVLLSFAASLLFSGGIAPDERADGGRLVLFEPPRGTLMEAEYGRLQTTFGMYLIFAMAALVTRAGAFHEERRRGTLQRTLSTGVPYSEVVVAHVMSVGLVGAIQAAVVVAVTSAFGAPWLASGWWVMILTVAGAFVACSGMAVAVAGVARSDGELQLISGAVPSLLAMSGGVFFTLEAAPASLRQLALVNPFHWCMELLNGGFLYGGFPSQAAPLGVLLLIGVMGMVIGVQGLRRLSV